MNLKLLPFDPPGRLAALAHILTFSADMAGSECSVAKLKGNTVNSVN